jgi:flagellar capping protein FliD
MSTTANSAISFQGLSTGLPTDALVNAILAQESKTLDGLTAPQTRTQQKTANLKNGGKRSFRHGSRSWRLPLPR